VMDMEYYVWCVIIDRGGGIPRLNLINQWL
jgi:hypothetical protein